MNKKSEKLYLNKLDDVSKNPPPNKYVLIYTDNDEVKPVRKSKKNLTLAQRMERLESVVIAGFKQVNDRIDRIEQRLDYNGLKPLPDKHN